MPVKLTNPQKLFLLERFAFGDGISTATKAFEKEYGFTITSAACWRYNAHTEPSRRGLSKAHLDYFDMMKARFEEHAAKYEIARRFRRVERLNKRWLAIEDLIDARGTELTGTAPGGETGLLAHDIKVVGGGDNAITVDVYEFDAALIKEERELAKQAAVELGQWEEKSRVEVVPKALIGIDIDDV